MRLLILVILFLPTLASARDLIDIDHVHHKDRAYIIADNYGAAIAMLHIDCDLTNAVSSLKGRSFIVPARSRVTLMTIAPRDVTKDWNFDYTYSFHWGKPGAKHDDKYAYRIPFSKGKKYRVMQGFGGSFSHTGSERFAIDWDVPQRTPVYAAREGLVVETKSDSNIGGPKKKYTDHANYILVYHKDGTRGHYVHLVKGGVAVRVGQTIRRGQFIGYSGNTGYSSEPHLHFQVSRVLNGKEFETIPFRYRAKEGDWINVKQNAKYTVSW